MLSELKISTRLIVMLAALIVPMLIIGGIGLYTASKANHAMHSMYNDRLTHDGKSPGYAGVAVEV